MKEKIPEDITIEYVYSSIFDNIFKNENRKNILMILIKKPKTISELQNELKLNYKTIWGHVQFLKNKGFIELKQDKNKAGKPIHVSINELVRPLIPKSEDISLEEKSKLIKNFFDITKKK